MAVVIHQECIVHVRGTGAHGYLELRHPLLDVSRAELLQRRGDWVDVFVRLSTVAGGASSMEMPQDMRGFAVRFYTKKSN